MLQKSVWQEGTTLRSAKVDALLNQTILVRLFRAKFHEKFWEKPATF